MRYRRRVVIAYALVIAGAAAGVFRAAMLLVRQINWAAFDAQITKLIAANNTDRAYKLCGAAPNSVHVSVSMAAIGEARQIHAGHDRTMVRERLLEAYRGAEKVEFAKLQSMAWLMWVAIGLAAGGVAAMTLSSDGGPLIPPLAIALGAVLAAAWSFKATMGMAAGVAARREPLVDLLAKWIEQQAD